MQRVLLAALVALSAAAVPARAQASATQSGGAARHTAVAVEYLSNDDYAVAVRAGTARYDARFMPANAPGVVAPAAAPDKPVAWYAIIFSATDWAGIYIPTREGTVNWGYTKAKLGHNLYNPNAINAPYHGYADSISGTRRTYDGVVVVNGNPEVQLRSVADTSHTSDQGTTPDGKIVGTITAYCLGYNPNCPSWVNG